MPTFHHPERGKSRSNSSATTNPRCCSPGRPRSRIRSCCGTVWAHAAALCRGLHSAHVQAGERGRWLRRGSATSTSRASRSRAVNCVTGRAVRATRREPRTRPRGPVARAARSQRPRAHAAAARPRVRSLGAATAQPPRAVRAARARRAVRALRRAARCEPWSSWSIPPEASRHVHEFHSRGSGAVRVHVVCA